MTEFYGEFSLANARISDLADFSRKKSICFFVIVISCFMSSRVKGDFILVPDYEGDSIEVELSAADELVPQKIEANYRSSICMKARYGAHGQRKEIEGFNGLEINFSPSGDGNFRAVVPLQGGGACKWRLRNIAFGMDYRDFEKFFPNISFEGGAGIVVMFYENRAQRSTGLPIANEGDLDVQRHFYPWVHENKSGSDVGGGFFKFVGGGNDYLVFSSPDARKISINYHFHPGLVARSTFPRPESEGKKIWYIYPDGSYELHNLVRPSFYKLEVIRREFESLQSEN